MKQHTKYCHIPTGDIYEYFTKGNEFQLWDGLVTVPASIVLNGKDWEEVKEKPEYTILSFRGLKNAAYPGKICFELNENGKYGGWATLEMMLDDGKMNGNKEIYSIRRESDGEVFTVGDDIEQGKITSIEILGELPVLRYTAQHSISYKIAQKVKPKEWEITAYINTISKGIRTEKYDDYDVIYSVKRLSDGVEFKIGDKGNHPELSSIVTIKEFEFRNSNIFLKFTNHQSVIINNKFKKIEKLFTTEDGVDIYEGDNIWGIFEDSTTIYQFYKPKPFFLQMNKKWFSSKEAAEKYHIWNKKAFSLADLESHAKEFPYCLTTSVLEGLSKYVK